VKNKNLPSLRCIYTSAAGPISSLMLSIIITATLQVSLARRGQPTTSRFLVGILSRNTYADVMYHFKVQDKQCEEQKPSKFLRYIKAEQLL
jgi:hypothetical protein